MKSPASLEPETMASYKFDPKRRRTRVHFRYQGVQYDKTVPAESDRAADCLRALVEETVQDLERGKLTLPEGADPVAFMLSGGKVVRKPTEEPPPVKVLALGDLFELYRADPPPHLEDSTRRMQEIHFRRLLEVLPDVHIRRFDAATAQGYVTRRAKQTYRGKVIQRDTIAKELQTLRQVWEWVASRAPGVAAPPFALHELRFPKGREKLPFMSWAQIEGVIGRGGLSGAEIKQLWDCLWLDSGQVRELLDHVQSTASEPFVYPLFCFAAYTGARRSELCRSRISDWKFDDGTVQIRQKKRDKDKDFTYRDVPLHPRLIAVMRDWVAAHPGGHYAVCRPDGKCLSWITATYHFKRSLSGSKWAVVRGWHVPRHSFASNLAAGEVDQRKIDRWMGHSTDIKWRYQHLLPEDRLEAIGIL